MHIADQVRRLDAVTEVVDVRRIVVEPQVLDAVRRR